MEIYVTDPLLGSNSWAEKHHNRDSILLLLTLDRYGVNCIELVVRTSKEMLWNNSRILSGVSHDVQLTALTSGIICVSDLFYGSTMQFLSFDQVMNKYHLQRNQFWRYVKMWSTLSKWLGSCLTCPIGSPVETLLTKMISYRGIASKNYNLLQKQLSDPLIKVKTQWVEDIAMDIASEDRKSCLTNITTMYKEMGNRFIYPAENITQMPPHRTAIIQVKFDTIRLLLEMWTE